MKVVIATGIFPPDVGGPATFAPMIAEAWSRMGHEVAVVTYSDKDDGIERPYRIHRIPRALPAPIRYFNYFLRVRREAIGARAVFAQDPVAAGLPAWCAARLGRRKFILKFVGDFAWEHARVQERYDKTIEEFHRDRSVSARIMLLRFLQRFVARRAAKVIVPSRYLGDLLKSWGVKEKRLRVIYNGVEKSDVSSQMSDVRSPHRIVTAGRLVPWKGFDTLISAMPEVLEKIPDASLMIIGDGPDEARLRSRAEALGLEDRINFTGRLKREEVSRAMRASGVFALVSSYEGFSHLLVEAFMAGAAVVASRAGGNTELVRDGENGLLVDPGDTRATAKTLLRFLQDRGLAERCARQAKEDARGFSIETQIEETTEAVLGRNTLRVVMISRDASIADPSSRAAARMRLYAEKAGVLSIIILARRTAGIVHVSDRVTATVIDVRRPFSALIRAVRAGIDAVKWIDANLVTAQDPFEAGLVGWLVARKTGRPLIIEEHGSVFIGPYWKETSAKNRALYGLGLKIMRGADGVRTVSARVLNDVKKHWPKKPVEEIPVYTEPIACAQKNDRFDFGYVGRLAPEKNLPMLLRAFHAVAAANPEARLLMVGSGPEETALRIKAAEYGLGDRVVWQPHMEDVAQAYAAMKTLVLPSWYEGWGRVAVEAMHCGLPVVMTDVGCAGEAVRDGKEGRVVPVGDAEALAQAMLETLDPSKYWWYSQMARKRAAELDGPEALVERLVAFWKKVAGVVEAPSLKERAGGESRPLRPSATSPFRGGEIDL